MFDIKEYGALIAGVAAFFTSLLGWVKWGTDKSKTPVSIAVKGNSEIQDIIDQIVRNNEHINIVTVTEITNGGGIPEVGKPLYMKSLLSTDAETLLMYSDKYLLEGSLTTATSKVILNGDGVVKIERITRPEPPELLPPPPLPVFATPITPEEFLGTPAPPFAIRE